MYRDSNKNNFEKLKRAGKKLPGLEKYGYFDVLPKKKKKKERAD